METGFLIKSCRIWSKFEEKRIVRSMKYIVVSPKNRTAYNFRGDLIRKIINCGNEVIVTGPNRMDVAKIEELGARFVEVPNHKNSLNPFADLHYLHRLCKLFRQEKPDAVFGYTSKPVIYGSIAARITKVSHIVAMVTGAGYAFAAETAKAKIIKAVQCVLYKQAFACADVVIFQNTDDRGQFVREGLVREEKSRVVDGSGVNMEKFTVAPYPETVTFFMLARMIYAKGIREYLQACEMVKQKHPEVRCMILGNCENLPDALSEAELKSYVQRGIVEHFGETDAVADYYKQCSVFVLPSYYREGTPRTILEAMAMGRPIITTDAPGCRETVLHGENGYLVPVRDSKAIAEKMLSFVENPEQIETMGQKSLEYCRRRYDVHKVNEDMCRYLRVDV